MTNEYLKHMKRQGHQPSNSKYYKQEVCLNGGQYTRLHTAAQASWIDDVRLAI